MDSYLNSMTTQAGSRPSVYGGEMDRMLDSRRGMSPSVARQKEFQEMERMRQIREMENQIPPGAEDYPIAGDPGPKKAVGVWSLTAIILGGIAMLTIIIFMAWYFGSGYYRNGTLDSIKNIVNNDLSNTSPTFKNLIVKQDTTLGDSGADTLAVNARVSTNLIPQGDGSKDLGSSDNGWGDLYLDSVVYDSGASIIQGSDNMILVTDQGLGYRRPIQNITVDGVSSGLANNTFTTSQSGYTFVLNEGDSYNYALELPSATGSGVFYDFVFGTSIATDNPAYALFIDTVGSDTLTGLVTVVEYPGGSGTSSLNFAPEALNNQFAVDFLRPAIYDLGAGISSGVLQGSYIRMTDYASGEWLIDGSLLVNPGVTGAYMNPPFLTEIN